MAALLALLSSCGKKKDGVIRASDEEIALALSVGGRSVEKPTRPNAPASGFRRDMRRVSIDKITGQGYVEVRARLGARLPKPSPAAGVGVSDLRLPNDFVVVSTWTSDDESTMKSDLVDVRHGTVLASFVRARQVSVAGGYLAVTTGPKPGARNWGIVGLVDGHLTPLSIAVASGAEIAKARVDLFPWERKIWIFAKDVQGHAYAEALDAPPSDGKITLRTVFPSLPDRWDRNSLPYVGWDDGEVRPNSALPCAKMRLLPNGGFRCVPVERFDEDYAEYDSLSLVADESGLVRGEKQEALIDVCKGKPLVALHNPAHILAWCQMNAQSTVSQYALWTPEGRYVWQMGSYEGWSFVYTASPIWAGPGSLIEGTPAPENWIDLERGIWYSTPPLVPAPPASGSGDRFVPVLSDRDPSWVLVLDLEHGLLERGCDVSRCNGTIVTYDVKDGRALLGCETGNFPGGAWAWSLVLDMKAKTFARTNIRVDSLTSSGLIIGRAVKNRTSSMFRVDLVDTRNQ